MKLTPAELLYFLYPGERRTRPDGTQYVQDDKSGRGVHEDYARKAQAAKDAGLRISLNLGATQDPEAVQARRAKKRAYNDEYHKRQRQPLDREDVRLQNRRLSAIAGLTEDEIVAIENMESQHAARARRRAAENSLQVWQGYDKIDIEKQNRTTRGEIKPKR